MIAAMFAQTAADERLMKHLLETFPDYDVPPRPVQSAFAEDPGGLQSLTQRGQVRVFGQRSSNMATPLDRKTDQTPTLQSSCAENREGVQKPRRSVML
jgi:hypothetical protein